MIEAPVKGIKENYCILKKREMGMTCGSHTKLMNFTEKDNLNCRLLLQQLMRGMLSLQECYSGDMITG